MNQYVVYQNTLPYLLYYCSEVRWTKNIVVLSSFDGAITWRKLDTKVSGLSTVPAYDASLVTEVSSGH